MPVLEVLSIRSMLKVFLKRISSLDRADVAVVDLEIGSVGYSRHDAVSVVFTYGVGTCRIGEEWEGRVNVIVRCCLSIWINKGYWLACGCFGLVWHLQLLISMQGTSFETSWVRVSGAHPHIVSASLGNARRR